MLVMLLVLLVLLVLVVVQGKAAAQPAEAPQRTRALLQLRVQRRHRPDQHQPPMPPMLLQAYLRLTVLAQRAVFLPQP